MRRSSGQATAHDREANLTINVLLRELEAFNGIVIFATNLAANFDKAFERRIRTHVLFDMPGLAEREQIWHLQIHPRKTPLASDVDFRQLAERYAMSGGDIKNAVIKAAASAAGEAGAEVGKRISQQHFEQAAQDVLAAKSVMQQSLFADEAVTVANPVSALRPVILAALGLAAVALFAALLALGLVLLK